MLGDLLYSLGTLAGTAVGTVEHRLQSWVPAEPRQGDDLPGGPDAGPELVDGSDAEDAGPASDNDHHRDLLVDSLLASAAGWAISRVLRPRSVSWPRAVIGGVAATVLADVVDRTLEPRDIPPRDPDAVLTRLAAGVVLAAGYGALLYPRLPGSPVARGLIFGAMQIGAAPHGGLVRLAIEIPGLKLPLKDLAQPIDDDVGPLANLTFGAVLGLLYRGPAH